ncbi:MAG: PKD domain-containing protein, partial [Flavobacteriales bacterium]|nr:PKD domain-containing protein [Flavobacteriales bacterium]
HIPSNASDSAKFLNTTFYGIYFVNSLIGYACGNHASTLNRIIFKTTDGGLNWTESYNAGSPLSYFRDITFTTANRGVVVGNSGAFFETTNGGSSWSFLGAGTISALYRVQMLDSLLGYISGVSRIKRTIDGGSSWTNVNNFATADIFFTSKGVGFASGGSSLIHTTDSGGSWTTLTTNIQGSATDLYFTNDSTGYAVTPTEIYQSVNSGMDWDPQVVPGGFITLNRTYILNSGVGFAVGDGGLIWRTTNGGGNVIPKAYFSVDNATKCVGDTFNFTNTSTPANNFQWAVNGIVFDTTYNFTYTPPSAGVDTVLLISERNGVYDSLEMILTVDSFPTASFTFTTTDLTATFSDVSSYGGLYVWAFGDSTAGGGANITHTYPASWEYEACLNVSNSCGVDTVCDSVFVSINQNDYTFNLNVSSLIGGDNELEKVIKTADNGYIAVGHSSSFGVWGDDPAVVKFDAAGNVSWFKTYSQYTSTHERG